MEKLKYHLGFALIPQIGAGRGRKLLNHFGDFQSAWQASLSDLIMAGIEQDIAELVIVERNKIDIDCELEKIINFNIGLVGIGDEEYPNLLREIYNPPYLLFVRGGLKKQDDYSVAIVGSRRFSEYGKQVTLDIASRLADNSVTIVSGLALGIDSFAHRAALNSPIGRTIAVLGCGIDDRSIYPSENLKLAHEIIKDRGAIISEYPPGVLPLKQHFPSRNRIVSGLSRGVVVVEAAVTSGSLITARHALEQGRDVFAVPGNIYNKNAQGPNSLIKIGAKLIESPDDVLEEMDLERTVNRLEAREIVPETAEEKDVLMFLEVEPLHIDELVRKTGRVIADLNSLLVTMEMKGLVKDMGGGNYIATRK